MGALGNLFITLGRKLGGSLPLNVLHVAIAATVGGAITVATGLLLSKDDKAVPEAVAEDAAAPSPKVTAAAL